MTTNTTIVNINKLAFASLWASSEETAEIIRRFQRPFPSIRAIDGAAVLGWLETGNERSRSLIMEDIVAESNDGDWPGMVEFSEKENGFYIKRRRISLIPYVEDRVLHITYHMGCSGFFIEVDARRRPSSSALQEVIEYLLEIREEWEGDDHVMEFVDD